MQVVLYSRDGNDSVEDVSHRITNLRFSTALHGGFKSCTFQFKSDSYRAYKWYKDYLGYVIRVYGRNGELAWEGRLEDIELPSRRVICFGFYNYIGDKYYDDGSMQTTAYELYSSSNQDADWPIDNGRKLAQLFYLDDDRPIDAVALYLKNTNSATGDMTASIYATSGGTPTGSALVTSGTYNATNVGSSYSYFTFAMPASYLFQGGTTYALVFERAALDTEQGTLTYSSTTFQDTGQDFSDWETSSGSAVYKIEVINTDSSITWGYLGSKISTDTINVYTDSGLTSAGWNGAGITGKTPSTYVIQSVGQISWGIDSSSPTYTRGYTSYWNGISWTNDTGKDAIFQIYVRGKWDYTTSTATVKDIVTDILSNISYINSDRSYLTDTGATIGPIKFSNNERANQAVERVCKYGASSGSEPVYFAVWEGAMPYLFARSSYRKWWNVRLRDLAAGDRGYSIVRSLSEMYNRVSVIYSDESGKQDVTAWSGNTDSQTTFGMTRELRAQSGNSPESLAIILRDLLLEDKKDAHQASNLTLVNVLSENYRPDKLWRVRAGDMLRLIDLDPNVDLTDTSTFDDTRRMFIVETEYDADRRTLKVTPDMKKRELDVIATQLGISGVSSL